MERMNQPDDAGERAQRQAASITYILPTPPIALSDTRSKGKAKTLYARSNTNCVAANADGGAGWEFIGTGINLFL
jgi:hypothetical protein